MFYNTQGYYLKNNFVETFADITPNTLSTSTTAPNTLSTSTTAPNTLSTTANTNSCDNLIKQSYADFDKKYQLLKIDYDIKLKEQKDITDSTMKQFLDETEAWDIKFKKMQKIQEDLINKEKKKLDDLKTIFEEKIKSLNSSINDISISIKKI